MRDDLQYYNYVAFYRGIPVYVGKGSGDRWKHTIYGQSGSEMLNDFFFRKRYLNDMPLDTYIVKHYKTDAEALKGEKKLIEKYKPYCNKCSGRYHSADYSFEGKLNELCKKEGYSEPEILESKFDFRFLFTPLGLLCRNVVLNSESPFEYAERNYHIRIKRDLFKHFPEFFLQFMTHDYGTGGENLTAFHTKNVYTNQYELCKFYVFKDHKYGKDWEVEAITGKSFDFAEEFGFKFKGVNFERYQYYHSLKEEHVVLFKKHQISVEIKERNKRFKAEKDAELALKNMGEEICINKRFGSNNIRVKATNDVLVKLDEAGFDILGHGSYINLSTTVKPFRSINVMSNYKLVKEVDFLSANLKGLKVK